MAKYKFSFLDYYHSVNNNKIFAGLIILIMNICTRYATLELSNSQEYYVKYIFGNNCFYLQSYGWGTRDIGISILIDHIIFTLGGTIY